MQKLIAIIWKDTLLRFSTLAEWLFFLILPVIFTLILAGGTGSSGGDNRITLLVADQAASPLSAELISAIGESGPVNAQILPLTEAEQIFNDRDAPALLVIPAEFRAESLHTGSVALDLRLLPNNTGALAVQQSVSTAISRVGSLARIAASSVSEANKIQAFTDDTQRAAYYAVALEAARTAWNTAPNRLLETRAATSDPVEYDARTNSSAGQMLTWVFIPLLGIAGVFVYERQIGTLRRMFVTPTRKGLYLFATILGQVVMALVQMAILVGFGMLVMNIRWGNLGALAAVLAASALAAAGIGMGMSAFIKTPGQANGIAIMSGMLMALLGGCWYPIELFPPAMQTISRILPTRWAMQGIMDIALRGKDLVDVLPVIAVLLGFAIISFAVGVWRFRYE